MYANKFNFKYLRAQQTFIEYLQFCIYIADEQARPTGTHGIHSFRGDNRYLKYLLQQSKFYSTMYDV